jgi:hypothetical protein
MAENFQLTVTRDGSGWHVSWSPDANAGDVMHGIIVTICGAAAGLGIEPREVVERALSVIEHPNILIKEVWRPEPPSESSQ